MKLVPGPEKVRDLINHDKAFQTQCSMEGSGRATIKKRSPSQATRGRGNLSKRKPHKRANLHMSHDMKTTNVLVSDRHIRGCTAKEKT